MDPFRLLDKYGDPAKKAKALHEQQVVEEAKARKQEGHRAVLDKMQHLNVALEAMRTAITTRQISFKTSINIATLYHYYATVSWAVPITKSGLFKKYEGRKQYDIVVCVLEPNDIGVGFVPGPYCLKYTVSSHFFGESLEYPEKVEEEYVSAESAFDAIMKYLTEVREY